MDKDQAGSLISALRWDLSCLWQERTWSSWFSSELRWLAKQIRPFLHWHLGSFLCSTAGSLLALLTPLILKWLIDAIIPQRRMGLLLFAVVLIFLAHEGKTALTSFGSFLMLSSAQKMGLGLRMSLLRHLNTLSSDYYEDTPVGAVMYPLKEPIDEISHFGSDLMPAILRMLLTTTFTLATMFLLSPVLTLTVVPLIPIFLVTRQLFRKRIVVDADNVQAECVQWNNYLQEHLSSVISVQLLGQEDRQERRLFLLLARAVRSQLKLYKSGTWFTVCSSLPIVLAMCAVIARGGVSVLAGALSTGTLVAFYGFIAQLFDPLSGTADLYTRAQRTFASIRRVQSALALRPTVANPPFAIRLPKEHRPQIEFVAVEFGYRAKKNFLHIPSLRILPGEHVAIGGENGTGKSTLVKLMARLYDPTSGAIHIDGEDLRKVDLNNLHQRVCYLPRDPALFDGTIASNLRFVRPAASELDLQGAIESMGLSDLIRSLPKGFRERIGPGGCQLSGGERQRLALARALLRRPTVLILDEATSCLDPLGEAAILRDLRRNLDTSTLIVISHRLATFNSFERIMTVAGGRIVYDSNHDAFSVAQAAQFPFISPA